MFVTLLVVLKESSKFVKSPQVPLYSLRCLVDYEWVIQFAWESVMDLIPRNLVYIFIFD